MNVQTVNVIGLVFSFIGSLCFARGLFISNKEALKLGVSRWSGDNNEENLTLPQVKDRLNQRNWAIAGAIISLVGFILQIGVQLL